MNPSLTELIFPVVLELDGYVLVRVYCLIRLLEMSVTYLLSQVPRFSDRCGEPSTPIPERLEVPVRTARVYG